MKNTKVGKLSIGLYEYQEIEWINSIKECGKKILDKSLLTRKQKSILTIVASGKNVKAYQFYTADNTGYILHAGVHHLGNISQHTIKKLERKWLAWRYEYVKNHKGDYPLALDLIAHKMPKYVTIFPIYEPESKQSFVMNF
jgi:hypothetical protein